MAIYSYSLEIWKNIRNTSNSALWQIGWQNFNPREPVDVFQVPFFLDTHTIEGAVETNLTSYRYGNEVICVLAKWAWNASGPNPETALLSVRFKDPSGNVFFTSEYWTKTTNDGDGWIYMTYVWIDYDEITTNWTYTVEQLKGTTILASRTVTFTNLTFPAVVSNSWAIWVENSSICFVNKVRFEGGYKISIDNDGVNYGTSIGNEGKIWVDTAYHGKLSYVDANGNIRRTHLANDWVWINTGGWTELPLSWKTPGMIWVSNNYDYSNGSYGYLVFVSYDWKAYRIMWGPK